MRAALGAFVAAAALMAAGCTTTVAGQAVPDTLVAKGTVGPAGTEVPTSTSVPTPTVGAESVPAPTSLAPGSVIGQYTVDRKQTYRCTAAFAARRGTDTFVVTAGHCLQAAGFDDVVQDLTSKPYKPIGKYVAAEAHGKTYVGLSSWPGDIDMGVVKADSGVRPNPLVAGRYRVASVLSSDQLQPGMELCKYGVTTRETCGPITSVTADTVSASLSSEDGDSGAPVYMKNRDGTVAAVAVLAGLHRFYLISRPLSSLGLTVD